MGGSALRLRRGFVEIQLENHYRRRGKTLSHLARPEAEKVVWLLRDIFAYQNKEIGALLHRSENTVSRYYQSANFFMHRRKGYEEQVRQIYMFIIYNGKFLP